MSKRAAIIYVNIYSEVMLSYDKVNAFLTAAKIAEV